MYRAQRRRIIRDKMKELLYEEYNKDKYPHSSRAKRKEMAWEEAENIIKGEDK